MKTLCWVIAFPLFCSVCTHAQTDTASSPGKKKVVVANSNDNLLEVSPEKYVASANDALNEKNLDEAKEDIDRAMTSPEINEKPKTLYVKAQIYLSLQTLDKYKPVNPYREAAQTLLKLVQVKPRYEKETVDVSLLNCAFFYFNDGVRAFNSKKYPEAIDYLYNVLKICGLDDGKRFKDNPSAKQLDTVTANAVLTIANSYYLTGKYAEAIPFLIKSKDNSITRSAIVYQFLTNSYSKQSDSKNEFATLQEGVAAYPRDVALRNDELNYYIKSGRQEEILKKLEETASLDSNDADIQFNLATAYLSVARPKNSARPANEAEFVTKSENAFLHAIRRSPDNAGYNYNLAALYFNLGFDVNDQMNAIGGTSKDEQKKYDALKAKRDELLFKSTPYFEKACNIFSANEKGLTGEDKISYKDALTALNKIYALQNKMDKAEEMKKKLDSLQ
jgi:predicted Zn-dependent protease